MFNWSLFAFIQLATSRRQSEIDDDENALTLERRHKPLNVCASGVTDCMVVLASEHHREY